MVYEKEALSHYIFHAVLEICKLAFYSTRNQSLDYVNLRKFYLLFSKRTPPYFRSLLKIFQGDSHFSPYKNFSVIPAPLPFLQSKPKVFGTPLTIPVPMSSLVIVRNLHLHSGFYILLFPISNFSNIHFNVILHPLPKLC